MRAQSPIVANLYALIKSYGSIWNSSLRFWDIKTECLLEESRLTYASLIFCVVFIFIFHSMHCTLLLKGHCCPFKSNGTEIWNVQ